jgi:hypothetical protein
MASWSFFQAGGVNQVVLRGGDDVARLRELDQKLWVALACPTKGTEIDEKTLALIDDQNDGRVRAPEILAAVEWSSKVWKSLDVLFEKGETLELAKLDDKSPEGKAVLLSAKRILRDVGKKDAKEITLEDVEAMEKAFVETRFNGDGVVPESAAETEDDKAAIRDVIAALGSLPDRSGQPGVDQKTLDAFFAAATDLVAWELDGGGETVCPLGADTGAAVDALVAVEAKLVDYFARTRLAAFDARASVALGVGEAELAGLAPRELSLTDAAIEKLPLAAIEPGASLRNDDRLNPAWAPRVAALFERVVRPLLGERDALGEAELALVRDKLAPYREWLAKKPTGPVAALPIERLHALVEGDVKARLDALVTEDLALAPEYEKITAVEKAIRFRRDLVRVLRNFVNFADFYSKKGASFQAGTLYLDGRSCDLVIYVNDAAKHAALAGLSKAYLAYCDCTRAPDQKMSIVAAFTAGDVDNLMVGRNGIFYDRKGKDWDATITRIVDAPISVGQAFWAPYKRLVRLIEEQVAKRAAEKEKESTASVDGLAAAAASADKAAPPAPAPAAPAPAAPGAPPAPGAPAVPGLPKKVDVGMVAALGVAVAGFATFLSSVLATFLGLGLWMPLGIVALLLAISGPSMLIAWLKLRQRNLGPILDANGWAINGLVRINVPFGGSLTKVAKLPEGASRVADDPYADKKTPWKLYLALFVVLFLGVVWLLGKVDAYLPDAAKAGTVLGRGKPAASAAPSAGPSAAAAAPAATAAPAK